MNGADFVMLRDLGAALPVKVAARLRSIHKEHGSAPCKCVDLILGPAEVKVYAQAAAAVGGAGIEGV